MEEAYEEKGKTRGDLEGVLWSCGKLVRNKRSGQRSNGKHCLLGLPGV